MSERSGEEVVAYHVEDAVATITMNRPRYHNAQNSRMTYALDAAFRRAVDDDGVRVIVLGGAGRNFSAGHDIGSPGQDREQSFERVSLWYDHVGREGGERQYVQEQEIYLGMCRRWRDVPKPTIAMVQGACIAGGLMLAWVCDLIIASEDAYFLDPVLQMGIPGVEYFAHPWELHPRIAKELLFTGDPIGARRACEMGMVNRVVPRESLPEETLTVARRIARMPRLALALAKQAVNHAEDVQGKRTAMDASFAWHHFAHTHNQVLTGDVVGGASAKTMAGKTRADGE